PCLLPQALSHVLVRRPHGTPAGRAVGSPVGGPGLRQSLRRSPPQPSGGWARGAAQEREGAARGHVVTSGRRTPAPTSLPGGGGAREGVGSDPRLGVLQRGRKAALEVEL